MAFGLTVLAESYPECSPPLVVMNGCTARRAKIKPTRRSGRASFGAYMIIGIVVDRVGRSRTLKCLLVQPRLTSTMFPVKVPVVGLNSTPVTAPTKTLFVTLPFAIPAP